MFNKFQERGRFRRLFNR